MKQNHSISASWFILLLVMCGGIIKAQNLNSKVKVSSAVSGGISKFNRFPVPADAVEDISKRTPYTTTWKTSDGKISVLYSSDVINRTDAFGNPLITGDTSIWNGGSTPSCIYPNFYIDSLLVTIPAGIKVTFFTIDYAYVSNRNQGPPIPINDGIFILYDSCTGKNLNDTSSCMDEIGRGDTAGICYLIPGVNFQNPFTTCISPSCNPQSFWLYAGLARRHGGVGCDTNYIWYSKGYPGYTGYQYHFSAYLEGTPILNLTNNSATYGGPCEGTAKVTPSGGTAPYSYLWSPNDQTTDSIGNLCIGDYCCMVTDNIGCSNNVCVAISKSTGINSLTNPSNISIYPDPNTGHFSVAGLERGQLIELYDYMGRKFNSIKADNTITDFDISDKANGVYLIRVINMNGSLVAQEKILKTE